jgi:Xaa-Pro aminopeptidase
LLRLVWAEEFTVKSLEVTMSNDSAFILGGVPATNMNVRHRIQFSVGDAVFYISLPQPDGSSHSILLVRDIEMGLARKHACADEIGCAADYEPEGGLSGDRDTALAEAGAEYLLRNGIDRVRTYGSLPMIFTAHLLDS